MDAVIHRVLLVDLNDLAELWEVSSTMLGLDITEDGHLVPKLIGADDNSTSVAEMSAAAERDFPDNNELDIVVQIHKTSGGNMIALSTQDQVTSPVGKACVSRWWSFTDDYVGQMH